MSPIKVNEQLINNVNHAEYVLFCYSSNASQQRKPDPNAALKRTAIIFILGLLGFMTLVVILTRVGRASADKDPFLDPLANPNIRVAGD